MKLQLLAIPLLLALVLSPLAAAAATGSISFTSPTAGSSFTGTASYTISGTITPTPTLPDNVFISVTNPAGAVVDAQQVSAAAGGTFSYPTNVGASSAWSSGTYTITATDSNGATGTTTFKYTASVSTTTGAVTVFGPSVLTTGQTADIVIWSSAPGTVTAWVLPAGATSTTPLTTARVSLGAGYYVYTGSYAVAATAATGPYLVGASISNSTSGFTGSGISSFTVNGGLATSAAQAQILTNIGTLTTNLATLQTAVTTGFAGLTTNIANIGKNLTADTATITSTLGTISSSLTGIASAATAAQTAAQAAQTAVTSLQNTVNTLSTTVNGITGTLTAIQSSLSTISSTVSGLSGLTTSVNNMNSTVSNDQTYILVVAALVVITLVLELAILIRKMS